MMTDHSPRSPTAAANGDVSSLQSRRPNLPSAWASVVRGDSEQTASPTVPVLVSSSPPPEQAFRDDNVVVESLASDAQPENSDVNGEGNAGGTRRTAWNKPINDVVVETGSVMGGAISWPALSESTRPVPRSSTDPARPGFDGSAPSSQAPRIPQPPWRQANSNTYSHSHSTISSYVPARPRTRNRGVGNGVSSMPIGGGPSQKNFSRPTPPPPPPPPPFPIFGYPRDMIPPMANAARGTRPIVVGEGPHSSVGNGHLSQRNTLRGNFGPRPRGDGPYHSNHAVRRDRDIHFTPQYGPPPPIGYMPPRLPPPFMTPPPMRIYSDMASPFIYVPAVLPESFGAMPLVPPSPSPVPFPPTNANRITKLLITQIDYYFSDVNLVADNFLRSNMDDQGWVPITLIASFPRVHHLTQDIPLIVESLKYSNVVEVQGDKLRKRYDWNKWLNASSRLNGDSASQSSSDAPENALAKSLQEISLNDAVISTANDNVGTRVVNTDIASDQPLYEEPSSKSRAGNGDNSSSG